MMTKATPTTVSVSATSPSSFTPHSTQTTDWASFTPASGTDEASISWAVTATTTTTPTTSSSYWSSTSSSATLNSTVPVIIPVHRAHIDNVNYYLPPCTDPPQTLWRSDGTQFNLTCDNVTLSTGEVFILPDDLPETGCQTVIVNGFSVCFAIRYPKWKSNVGTITCNITSESRLGSRATPDEVSKNLTAIANALAAVKDAISSEAEMGVSEVGCAAQTAFKQAASYYFNMVQQDLSIIQKDIDFIVEFFKDMFGYAQGVTTPVSVWIDQVDESFQELACFTNTPEGQDSRIWRTLTKHTSLHAGLNTLQSIQNVANVNVIERIIETILATVITDLHQQYTSWITSSGTIIEGWTQAWRLCSTKWELGNLEQPEDEQPNEDDEDDYLPRYAIYTEIGTSQTSFRGLEHALGGGGWELSTASYDTSLPNGYVVDLNLIQAQLPSTMPFVRWTYKKVWDGNNVTDQGYDLVVPQGSSSITFLDEVSHQTKREALAYPTSTDLDTLVLGGGAGNYLKSLSQQKGQEINSFNRYTYRAPRRQPLRYNS